MNRRQLITAAAALPLVGCAAASTAISDIETAAAALDTILPDIQKIVGLPAATYTLISNQIAAIDAAAKQYAANASATVGGQISAAWSSIQTALSGLTLPTFVGYVFQAVQVALPYILQVAGVALARAPRGDAPGALTYPQAMSVLHAAAGK